MAKTSVGSYLDQLAAMRAVGEALDKLPPTDVSQVLRWARETFLSDEPEVATSPSMGGPESGDTLVATGRTFASLADAVAAAAPQSGPDRALVVGYWFQCMKGQEDLEGALINSELKHLGHKLPNITSTMGLLMSQRPALVIQTKKTGTAQQARKRYRLTDAGIRRVESMLAATT